MNYLTKNLLESLDPIQKMNEDMKRTLDPMYNINKSLDFMSKYEEQIKAITNPFEDLQKQMEYMYNPMKKISEQMEEMFTPYAQIQKQMNALYSFEVPNFSHMDSITALTKSFQESLDTVLGNTSIKDQMDTLLESYTAYKEIGSITSSDVFKDITSSALNSIVKNIISREKEATEYVSSIESIEVIDESKLLEEIEEIRDSILEANSDKNIKIEEYLFNLNEYILSQKNPRLLLLFQTVILPIIITIMSSVSYDFAVKPSLESLNTSEKQQIVKKEIVMQVKACIPNPKIRVNYRIVKADVLNVREAKSRSSKVISSLSFGEVVEVINKERNWCLVKRYDAINETYVQGWVSTRYLAQIK